MGTITIAPNIHWVGTKDPSRRLFDGLIPLPHGTSYNAYLVMGTDKTALIDTTNPGFENELVDKVSQHMDPTAIDYVVMNHAEPDHASACAHMLSLAKGAKLVTSAKGKEAAMMYFAVPEEKIEVVDESSSLELGGKTLKFIDAPWLHWPETMFTYIPEDGVLFPCDFFGSHIAYGEFYADEFGNGHTLELAKLYFAEIMMPFRKPAMKAIEKVKALEPKLIAPSHGVMYREPKLIIDAYTDWAGEKMKRKVLIAYVSMWGRTEHMVKVLKEALISKGIEVQMFDLTVTSIGEVAKQLVDSPVLVIGAPTVLGGAHPVATYGTLLTKTLRAPTKHVAILSSYGWSGGAVKQLEGLLEGTNIDVLDAVDSKGPAGDEEISRILKLADTIAGKLDELP
ncbi:MAG: FprA family A-type flavoprotein [Methanobacteriota archaeon]|nr:MAG: FprA family A-type flavoprotein [Euryarchaeota archaeon]